jgi:O-antigen/teichoic acid export membrane protein
MATVKMLFDGIRHRRRALVGRRLTAVSSRRARQAGRRLGWGVADQAVSSITNFAVNIYIARDLGAVQYGAFALAFVTYGFALNASRGLATDPLLVRFSGKALPVWRRVIPSCTGTAVLVGLATGSCVLGAAMLLSGTTRLAFLALGLTLPGLLLQDSWRFAFFALGRGSQAFLNDVIWALALVPALFFVRRTGHANVFWFVFAWGASASVAAVIGPLQARVAPKMSEALGWLWRQRDLGPRYLAEGTTNSGLGQLRTYSLGLILGLAALGYLSAASTLMGPLSILIYGMGLVALPEAARILRHSPRHMPLFCSLISVGLTLLGLAWGLVLLVALPRGLGQWLLGSLWRPAYPLVLPTTLYFMGICASVGAGMWLHALAAARRSLRAAAFSSASALVFSVIGAVTGGTAGSIRGAALGTWAGALFCWWQLRVALKETGQVSADDKLRPGRKPGEHREPNGG